MIVSEVALILRWMLPLWALGWLVLPLSSRLFPFLPDQGLAAGRIVAIVLLGVVSYWGASLHFLPLSLAPLWFIAAPILVASGWKKSGFRAHIASKSRFTVFSDLVFLLSFGVFLWVRLRHPEASDLEKPMDMALISAAMRADFLPFENPWFAGDEFTNYYYFGPLLGALLSRTFAAPPYLAYNLVQVSFCAFFLSALWSLSAALAKSSKIGLLALFLVGIGGHFEPLRQIVQTGQFWPLDWWKTSRVVENTINEYPSFTLLTGDVHAHFYAFSLAITHLILCFGVIKAESARLRSVLLMLGGVFLGVLAITNTWDVPFYGLLWLGCAWWSYRASVCKAENLRVAASAIGLVFLVALPYFWRFHSQVSGLVFDIWIPKLPATARKNALFSLSLLWGSWWILGFFALGLPTGEEKSSPETIFRRGLIGVGVLALFFPYFFYIQGVFGGDLRHQDTVFKFGLQAWLLLGTGIACETGFRFQAWWKGATLPFRAVSATGGAAFLVILALAPACVAWTRAVRDTPRDVSGNVVLSLNAARFLPPDELAGIEWLRQNAKNGESVVESVMRDGQGNPVGDYNAAFGRVAAFSGVPCVLSWPQHVAGWGAPWDEARERAATVGSIYAWPNATTGLGALQKSKATFVFLGSQEWLNNGNSLPRLVSEAEGNQHLQIERRWDGKTTGTPQILRFRP